MNATIKIGGGKVLITVYNNGWEATKAIEVSDKVNPADILEQDFDSIIGELLDLEENVG